MTTGRYSDTPGNRTDPLYFGGSTVDETATAWPMLHPPGTVFRYANNDTLMAVKAISQWLDYYPPHEFFAKLGMVHTVAETDIRGGYILSSQVWTTAEDLAKFGQLYLSDGKLPSGERVLPEGWAQYVATPSGPQPDGAFGYGAGFWLMNKSDGVPPDTFAAFGNRGQYVVIVPSRQVVIVRRGEDPVGSGFDIAAFTRDVLAALENR
jgi:CubicO group peptidase (beta-lactamase class C family)